MTAILPQATAAWAWVGTEGGRASMDGRTHAPGTEHGAMPSCEMRGGMVEWWPRFICVVIEGWRKEQAAKKRTTPHIKK